MDFVLYCPLFLWSKNLVLCRVQQISVFWRRQFRELRRAHACRHFFEWVSTLGYFPWDMPLLQYLLRVFVWLFAQIYFINTYLEWYFVKVPYIYSTLNIHIFDQRKQFLKNSRENILPHRPIRKLHSVSLKYSFLRTGNTTSKMVPFVKTSYGCRPLATIVTTSFILEWQQP